MNPLKFKFKFNIAINYHKSTRNSRWDFCYCLLSYNNVPTKQKEGLRWSLLVSYHLNASLCFVGRCYRLTRMRSVFECLQPRIGPMVNYNISRRNFILKSVRTWRMSQTLNISTSDPSREFSSRFQPRKYPAALRMTQENGELVYPRNTKMY